MIKARYLVVAAALLLWPNTGQAQLDADRLLLPQRQGGRPILQVPGRSGRPDRTYYRDGISEVTYYAGSDRGEIRVEVGGARSGTGPTLSMTRPTQSGIMAELSREFPGQTMIVVRTPMRNAYGPIGMAASERCIYAWQWIESVKRIEGARERLFASSGARPASLRVKLCRRPGESITSLGRAVQRLRLADPLSATAARPAATPARSVSRQKAPELPPVAAAPTQPAPARPDVPAPTSPAPIYPAPARSAPAGGYANVPLPSSTQPVGQRPFVTSTDRPAASSPDRTPVAPQPAPYRSPSAAAPAVPVPTSPERGGETRRYITDRPTADSPAPPSLVPRPARGATESGEPFTGGLPPEAYRGPGR